MFSIWRGMEDHCMGHPLLFDWLKGPRDTFHAKFFAGVGVTSSKHHHEFVKGKRAWESEMGRTHTAMFDLKNVQREKKLSMFRFSVTYPQRCYLDSSYSLQILFLPLSQFPTLRSRSVHSNSQLTLYLAGGTWSDSRLTGSLGYWLSVEQYTLLVG